MKLRQLIEDAPTAELETERLVLRPMTPTDLPTAIAHEHDRAVMRWIRDPVPAAEIEARCRSALQPWSGEEGQWRLLAVAPRRGVELPAELEPDAMIGIVCFRVTVREHETMEVGYRLTGAVQRRGFASEACRALLDYLFRRGEVRRIVALCAADNEPSWRLMEKLGMRREGRFEEYSFLDGAWRDELLYAMLRREWSARAGSDDATN